MVKDGEKKRREIVLLLPVSKQLYKGKKTLNGNCMNQINEYFIVIIDDDE